MPIPTQADVERRLEGEDLDEWLRLWRVEQGPVKQAALDLIASVIPADRHAPLRVLDLCCGPGDVGRTIHRRFPNAEIDAVDRDIFLASLCKLVNRRAGAPGRTVLADLADPAWRCAFDASYDVIAVANALHWFTLERARGLLAEIIGLLRPGGVFLFLEPVSAPSALAQGFGAWRTAQPAQHRHEDWLALWSRINAFLGYEHMPLTGAPPAGPVGDSLTAMDWARLAEQAGFTPVDVLLRDPEKVVVAALKPA